MTVRFNLKACIIHVLRLHTETRASRVTSFRFTITALSTVTEETLTLPSYGAISCSAVVYCFWLLFVPSYYIVLNLLSCVNFIIREEPFVFQIGMQQMNEGWEKGLLQMCIGEKRKLTVPSDMAYGEVGSFGSESTAKIKPGATIVYDIELLDILDEEEAAPHLVWGL
jgi:FKBP-type peptidyl-prolyl cis-trans isomerase 2